MYRGSVLVPHPLLEESENFKRILAEDKFRLGYFATLPRTSSETQGQLVESIKHPW